MFVLAHKFRIGQTVDLMPRILRAAAAGQYEIRQLMPAPDADTQNPCYRVRSTAEKHDRIVPESDPTHSARIDPVLS